MDHMVEKFLERKHKQMHLQKYLPSIKLLGLRSGKLKWKHADVIANVPYYYAYVSYLIFYGILENH